MRAAFTDAAGPALWRRLPYLVPFALVALPVEGVASAALTCVAVLFFHVLALAGTRQRTPRAAEISCGPGYVDVKNAGTRSQRIHAKDITGGTTARTPTGVLLTLQHKRRDQPLTVELATEAEAETLRHALGIGHAGFGTIGWRTQTDGTQKAAVIGRFVTSGFALFTFLAVIVSGEGVGAALLALLLGPFGLIGAILGIIGFISAQPEPTIIMAAGGLRLKTPAGWFGLPFEAILHVEQRAGSIVFTVPPPYHTIAVQTVGPFRGGLSRVDTDALLSHILAASQRARGLGPQKNDVTGRVDVLRRSGETPRDWLVRLDMAGQMLSTGPGYRGNTLEVDDLWAILEDPDADADLRAAAARVLRHAPNTRVRIDAALAAVRDEGTNKRLRIAVHDDLDAASYELAQLDALDTLPRGRTMQR